MVSRATAEDPEDLIVSLVDHAAKLAGQIAGARLSFNKEKSCIVASSPWVAVGIAKLLKARGINLAVAEQVRDLGVDAGGGSRRATTVGRQRIVKATKRLQRIRGIVKSNRRSVRLIKTGAEPAWKYGVEAYGMPDGSINQIRAATANAAGTPGSHACPITACQIILGPEGDPLWTATTLSVRWWLGIWHEKPRFRRTLRECWHKARSLVVPNPASRRIIWRAVKGPIAAVIANLTRVG